MQLREGMRVGPDNRLFINDLPAGSPISTPLESKLSPPLKNGLELDAVILITAKGTNSDEFTSTAPPAIVGLIHCPFIATVPKIVSSFDSLVQEIVLVVPICVFNDIPSVPHPAELHSGALYCFRHCG